MTDGPTLALQKALVTALLADGGVAALVGTRVHDEPPAGVARPYIRLGNLQLDPFRTSGRMAWRVTFSIEAHGRPDGDGDRPGRVETTRVAEAVIAALDEQHAGIAVAGFIFSWCQFVTSVTERDTDGQSYRAITAFDAVLDVPA